MARAGSSSSHGASVLVSALSEPLFYMFRSFRPFLQIQVRFRDPESAFHQALPMTSTQKLLIVLASPLIVSIVLVGVGLASHHTEPIGAAGFLLLFICFNAFAFADKFLKRMRAFRAGKSFDRLASVFDARSRQLCRDTRKSTYGKCSSHSRCSPLTEFLDS